MANDDGTTNDGTTNDGTGNVTRGPFQGKPNTPTSKFEQLLGSVQGEMAKSAAEAVKAKAKKIIQEMEQHDQAKRQLQIQLDELRAKYEAGLPV